MLPDWHGQLQLASRWWRWPLFARREQRLLHFSETDGAWGPGELEHDVDTGRRCRVAPDNPQTCWSRNTFRQINLGECGRRGDTQC